MKTSQFCFSPRNFASRALTKNTMAWLTGVCIPCLGTQNERRNILLENYLLFSQSHNSPIDEIHLRLTLLQDVNTH